MNYSIPVDDRESSWTLYGKVRLKIEIALAESDSSRSKNFSFEYKKWGSHTRAVTISHIGQFVDTTEQTPPQWSSVKNTKTLVSCLTGGGLPMISRTGISGLLSWMRIRERKKYTPDSFYRPSEWSARAALCQLSRMISPQFVCFSCGSVTVTITLESGSQPSL